MDFIRLRQIVGSTEERAALLLRASLINGVWQDGDRSILSIDEVPGMGTRVHVENPIDDIHSQLEALDLPPHPDMYKASPLQAPTSIEEMIGSPTQRTWEIERFEGPPVSSHPAFSELVAWAARFKEQFQPPSESDGDA